MTDPDQPTPESIAAAKAWRDAQRRWLEEVAGVVIGADGHARLRPEPAQIEEKTNDHTAAPHR